MPMHKETERLLSYEYELLI